MVIDFVGLPPLSKASCHRMEIHHLSISLYSFCFFFFFFTLHNTTPQIVELCGHATLASAHVIYEKGLKASDEQIKFFTKSGTLKVWKEGGLLHMDFPMWKASKVIVDNRQHGGGVRSAGVDDDAELVNYRLFLKGLGLVKAQGEDDDEADERAMVNYYGRNVRDLLLELKDEQMVLDLKPDFSVLEKVDGGCLIVTAAASPSRKGVDFVSRVFVPRYGIPEGGTTYPWEDILMTGSLLY